MKEAAPFLMIAIIAVSVASCEATKHVMEGKVEIAKIQAEKSP